jgi:hypothetical protein
MAKSYDQYEIQHFYHPKEKLLEKEKMELEDDLS